MISALALVAAISFIGTLHSDLWPPHGHFQVSAKRGAHGQTICQLESSAHDGADFFALALRGATEDGLEGVLMSNRPDIGQVRHIDVTLDDEHAVSFVRAYTHGGKDFTAVVGRLEPDHSATLLALLRQRAVTAKSLTVIAPPLYRQIPAAGLSAALNEFDYCLQPLIP